MTLEGLRAIVRVMRARAARSVWTYGRALGADDATIAPMVAALGEISVDEACAALEREARRGREDG